MQATAIGEAKTWASERPAELAGIAEDPHRLRLWRCAQIDDPYFGRGSHWTPHRPYSEWRAREEARLYPHLPPLAVFRADVVVFDAAIIDLRHHVGGRINSNRPLPTYGRSDAVVTAADRLTRRGVEWVLLSGDLLLTDDQPEWTEAVYIGPESVEAVRAEPVELDSLP